MWLLAGIHYIYFVLWFDSLQYTEIFRDNDDVNVSINIQLEIITAPSTFCSICQNVDFARQFSLAFSKIWFFPRVGIVFESSDWISHPVPLWIKYMFATQQHLINFNEAKRNSGANEQLITIGTKCCWIVHILVFVLCACHVVGSDEHLRLVNICGFLFGTIQIKTVSMIFISTYIQFSLVYFFAILKNCCYTSWIFRYCSQLIGDVAM